MSQKQGNFVVYRTPSDIFVVDKIRGGVLVAEPQTFDSYNFDATNGFTIEDRRRTPGLEHFFHDEETVRQGNEKLREFERLKQNTRPTTFFIAETISCPLSCGYCFEKDARGKDDKKRLVEEDIRKIDQTIEAYRKSAGIGNDKVCINLFGGEPLQPAFFELNKGLLELARDRGYFVDVITSGATITGQYLDLLTDHKNRIREVDITLDGPKEIQDRQRPIGKPGSQRGTYDLVTRSIDGLLERGVRVLAKQNLGVEGLKALERHVGEMKQRGWYDSESFVHGINLIQDYGGVNAEGQKIGNEGDYLLRVIDTFSGKDMQRALERTRFEGIKFTEHLANASGALLRRDGSPFDNYPRYAHCHPTDGTTVTIAPNGDIYGCNWSIGKTKPFGNIFANPDFASMRQTFVRNVVDNPLCNQCDVSTSCGGGCRHAQMMSGTEQYHLTCQDGVYKSQLTFLEGARQRGLFDRKGKDFMVASPGFNLNYTYENRAQ